MALIPQEPKQQKALVAIVVALAGMYAFYTYWYTPRRDAVDTTVARVQNLETLNNQARVQAARGGSSLEETNALYERYVMQLEELIPEGQEVPALIEDINRQGVDSDVTISVMTPNPDQPGQYYTQESWVLQVIGDYHEVGRFLTRIASMPRIISPVGLNLTRLQNTQNFPDYEAPVVADFQIELYTMPEQTAPTSQVGAGGGA